MHDLARRLAALFGVEALAGIARLGVPLVIARALGPAQYGAFALATSLCLLVFSLAASGMPLTAMYSAARSPGRGTVKRLFATSLLVTVPAVIVGWPLALLYGSAALHELSYESVLLAVVAVVPYGIEATALGVLRGRGLHERAAWWTVLRQVAIAVAVGVIGWVGAGADEAVVAFGLCTVAFAAVAARSAFPPSEATSTAEPRVREIMRYLGQVQASALITFLNYRLSFLVVGALATETEAGVFAIALTVAEAVWFFSYVVSNVIVGEVAGRNAPERSRALTLRACRLVTLASVLVASVIAGCSPFVMGLFGVGFASGWSTLAVSCLAACVLAPSRVLATYESASGSPESNVRGSAIGLVVNVALTSALVPALGILGAALSTVVAYGVIAYDRISRFRSGSVGDPRPTIFDVVLVRRDDVRSLALLFDGLRARGPKGVRQKP